MNPRFLGPLLLALVCPCVASTITISTTSVPNGTVKTAYSAVINASKGCTPYKMGDHLGLSSRRSHGEAVEHDDIADA